MPRLALNRKDMGGELSGRNARLVADPADLASKRFQCGGIVASGRTGSRNRGHIAS
jgi:hypothetical protein